MSQIKRNQFQLTILAMAVLSLGACSTTSNTGGFDFGAIGTGLGKIGSKTAELGSNAWEGTKNVLHIGPQEPQLLDEVDLALMEDDAVPQIDQTQIDQTGTAVVQLGKAEPNPVLPRNALKPSTAGEEGKLAFGQIPEPTTADGQKIEEVVVLASSNQEQPMDAASGELPVVNAGTGAPQLIDLTHEVKADENLWQIAKSTTGDANNWHILADINNLAPNASVFPGQRLTIPADMVKPEYSGVDEPVISEVAQAKLPQPEATTSVQATVAQTATQAVKQPVDPNTASATVALKIPETKPEIAAASAEQTLSATPAAPTLVVQSKGNATALKVGAGETLWDFAKRTTGNATNWNVIAEHNGFDEQQIRLIRPGQKIQVPANILRARDANGDLIAKGEEADAPTANIGGIAPKNSEAIAATAAVLTGTNKPADAPSADATPVAVAAAKAEPAGADIKIVEAAFQENGAIKPVTAESLSEQASLAVNSNDDKLGKVMVKGTYYPKAVYNNADFSSTLLMRVSPGTQLLVSKAIGPWLEVKTEKGVGYVHSRDIK